MEKSNDGTFEFGSSASVDSVWGECFPDDVFTNVGSDEEGDTGSETVAFGQELVEEHDDQGCGYELEDE